MTSARVVKCNRNHGETDATYEICEEAAAAAGKINTPGRSRIFWVRELGTIDFHVELGKGHGTQPAPICPLSESGKRN